MILLRIQMACILCFFTASIHAAIDSGGGMAYVGNLQAHASVGSPFSTSAVTAGAVDILYPLESSPGTTPVQPPPDTTPTSAPITPAAGVKTPAAKNSSAKKSKKMSPNKSPAKKAKKNSPKKTAKKSNKK
jgi:hypothetical protein